MAVQKGRVFSGARARFLIQGKKVGYARNCSGSESYEYEGIKALDNIQLEEHVPTGYTVSFSAEAVRIVGASLKAAGFLPKLGTSPQEHLRNVLTTGVLTCTIEDNQTGAVIMTLEQARVTSNSFTIDASGIVSNSIDFVAIRMRDESEV